VTPNLPLFAVARDRRHAPVREGERDRSGCTIHLATSREAAFGRCLAPYRPRYEIVEKLDAFLQPADADEEPLPLGALCGRFFDHRVLYELRSRRDACFEPASAPTRFRRIKRSRFARGARDRALQLGIVTSASPVGQQFRLAHWDYLGIWDRRLVRSLIAVLHTTRIDLDDPDLLQAAARLDVTLT